MLNDYESIRRNLLEYYTERYKSDEANDAFLQAAVFLTRDDPEAAWSLILTVVRDAPAAADLGTLGAGPLENLLCHHGAEFIERVENEALRSVRFREVLAHVWKSDIDEAVWRRLYDFVLKHREQWEVERQRNLRSEI